MNPNRRVSLAELAQTSSSVLRSGDLAHLSADARPSLADLAECLSFSPADGHIWLNDQRMMLMHGNSFGALRRELIDSLGIEKARGLFTRMGYIAGARDARIEKRIGNSMAHLRVSPGLVVAVNRQIPGERPCLQSELWLDLCL